MIGFNYNKLSIIIYRKHLLNLIMSIKISNNYNIIILPNKYMILKSR